MGLILKPSEVKNCTEQMRSQIESNRNSYAGALQTVQKFAENNSFQSESWNILKGKVVTSHQLINKGMLAVQDSMLADLNTADNVLGDAADSEEDMLIQDILRLQEECNRYIEMIKKICQLPINTMKMVSVNISLLINHYQEMLEKAKAELEELKKELNTLYEKTEQTSSLFQTVGELLGAIECAINDAEVYITGRGTLSDESWQVTIPDLVEEYYKGKNKYALENFLYKELGIAIDEFEELYGEETINTLCESVNAIGIEEVNDEVKEKVITIILEETSGQKVAKVDDKYQFLYGANEVMLEFEQDRVGEIVMDVAYSNTDVKKRYIASYLKENLPECDDIHIAAIMGNMQAESGLSPLKSQGNSQDLYNPEYIEKYNIKDGRGWGLVQWSYPTRKEGFEKYVGKKEKKVNSCKPLLGDMDTQLEYLVIEFKGEDEDGKEHKEGDLERQYNKFITIKDLDDATEYFCNEMEIPNEELKRLTERKQFASEIYDELAN